MTAVEHPQEMFETPLEINIELVNEHVTCGICGGNHSPKHCSYVKLTTHVPDKPMPSKARLTLPDSLEIRTLSDGSFSIYARDTIDNGTFFGPFDAKNLFTLYPAITFPLKIFLTKEEDFSEYYLDTSNEYDCNWMVFVNPANELEEQNILCYQENNQIFYVAFKEIPAGQPLKVWYAPYYAEKMKKDILTESTSDNVPIENLDINELVKKQQNIRDRDMWNCKFCGKIEVDVVVFANHIMEHYQAQLKRICEICKDVFKTRTNLKKHMKVAHSDKFNKVQTKNSNSTVISDTKEVKEVSLGGPLLNNILTDSMDNTNLILSQTDLNNFDIGNIDNQNSLESETLNLNVDNLINENVKALDHFNFEINESDEQFVCDVCLKSFSKLRSLVQHLQQHTGQYICKICTKVFCRKENLATHGCNSSTKLECEICGKYFAQKKYLTQHMIAVHKKRFKCDTCNKVYCSKLELSVHNCSSVPVSQKENFKCHICQKVFFREKYLKHHLTRHDQKKIENYQIVCEICCTILKSRKSYMNHKKLHSEPKHQCEICDKKFRRLDTLNFHLNSHSKNFLFSCTICEKKMKSKKLLNVHMQTHKPEKTHKCEICQVEFKQRPNLLKHKKQIHSNEKRENRSVLKNLTEIFDCPLCEKKMKLKSSLSRHIKRSHNDYYQTMNQDVLKPKKLNINNDMDTSTANNDVDDNIIPPNFDEDSSISDLKETIENMNFTSDIGNCNDGNDINLELENMLNSTTTMDNLLSDSNDKMVENLLNIAAQHNQVGSIVDENETKDMCFSLDNSHESTLNALAEVIDPKPREVCLSMPDLTENDEEIRLGQNAYILDNGTIVEPQDNSDKVVVYILDQKFSQL